MCFSLNLFLQLLILFYFSYAVPNVPFAVSSNVDCGALNKLVNELLREKDAGILKDIEFDFLISGELLRETLLEHLKDRTILVEDAIEVEYIQRTPAPEPENALLHDDWVCSVQVADRWYERCL